MKNGIQPQQDPNALVLRCAQEQHHSESLAQCELPPPHGRSTPEPAQQYPQSKVEDPLHAQHNIAVPKPSLPATGIQLELLCPSALIHTQFSPLAAVNVTPRT